MLDLDSQKLLAAATARPATVALLNIMRLAGGTPPAVTQARKRCCPDARDGPG
jgi:hypothetical protein